MPNPTITPDELSELERLRAAATQGEWNIVRSVTCGHLRAEQSFGRLWTWCEKCSPVQAVKIPVSKSAGDPA